MLYLMKTKYQKFIVAIFLVFFSTNGTFGENMLPNDSTMLYSYLDSARYYQSVDLDQAIFFGLSAQKLAKKNKSDYGYVKAGMLLGNCYRYKQEYDAAFQQFFDIERHYVEMLSDKELSFLDFSIAKTYNGAAVYDSAIFYYHQSLSIDSKMGDTLGMAIGHNNVATILLARGVYSVALENGYKALSLYALRNNEEGVAICNNNIGLIFQAKGNYKKSVNYLQRATAYFQQCRDSVAWAKGLNNIGSAFLLMDNYALALDYYQHAVDIKKVLSDSIGLGSGFLNMGLAYLKLDDFQRAEYYFNRSARIAGLVKSRSFEAELYKSFGQLYVKTNNRDKAKISFLKSYDLAVEMELIPLVENVTFALANIYDQEGDFERAYFFRTEEMEASAKLLNEEMLQRVTAIEMEEILKSSKKEQRQQLDFIRARQKTVLLHQKKVTAILVVALVVVLLFSFWAVYLYLRKLKLNNVLNDKEKKLQEQYNYIKVIFDNNIVGMVHVDLNRKILRYNNAIVELVGDKVILAQQIDAKIFFINPEVYAEFGQKAYSIIKAGETFQSEHQLKNSKGELRWMKLLGRLIDINNPSLGVLWLMEDVTQNYILQEQLRLFKKFAESSGQGLGIANLDYSVVYTNPALREMLDIEQEINQPTSVLNSYPDVEKEKLQNDILPAVLKNGAWSGELKILGKNGKIIPTLENFFLINDEEGNPLCYADIITDISRIKNFEKELKQAIRTRDIMMGVVAHDLRGPVGAIKNLLELVISDDDVFDEQEKQVMLSELHESAIGAYDLLENVLFWAKNQQNKVDFYPENLDVNVLMKEVYEQYQLMASKKGITLKMSFNGGVRANLDRQMIHCVVRNLLSNAIKFSDAGSVVKMVVKDRVEQLEIQIIDQGIGMTPMQQKVLMAQGHIKSTVGTGNEMGSGVGLQLCKFFVDKHNGLLSVDSIVDKGTTFSVLLPK